MWGFRDRFSAQIKAVEESERERGGDLRSRSDGVIAAAIERAAGLPDGSLLIFPEIDP
jgi:hypothetical protein